jgi:hypothetical protein
VKIAVIGTVNDKINSKNGKVEEMSEIIESK